MGVGRGIGGWTGLLVRVTVMKKRRSSRRRRNMLLSFLHDLQHNNYILSHNRFYYFLTWHAIKVLEIGSDVGGALACCVPVVIIFVQYIKHWGGGGLLHLRWPFRVRVCLLVRLPPVVIRLYRKEEGHVLEQEQQKMRGKKEVFTRQIFKMQRSGLKQKQTNFTELKDFRPIRVQ